MAKDFVDSERRMLLFSMATITRELSHFCLECMIRISLLKCVFWVTASITRILIWNCSDGIKWSVILLQHSMDLNLRCIIYSNSADFINNLTEQISRDMMKLCCKVWRLQHTSRVNSICCCCRESLHAQASHIWI